MELFDKLIRQSPNRMFLSILLGMGAGLASAILIPLLMRSIDVGSGGLEYQDPAPLVLSSFEIARPRFAALFLIFAGAAVGCRFASTLILNNLSIELAAQLRLELFEKIRASAILGIERVGPAALVASLTTDVPQIVSAAQALPQILTNALMLVTLLGVLAYANLPIFKVVALTIVAGVMLNQLIAQYSRRYLRRSRENVDRLHEGMRGLIYGAKELKLDIDKSRRYFEGILLAASADVASSQKSGQTLLRVAGVQGELLHYLALACIAFVLAGYYRIPIPDLVLVIMVTLFAIGPLSQLLAFVPLYLNARISIVRIARLGASLQAEQVLLECAVPPPWDAIRLERVTFRYGTPDKGLRAFCVGPVSLELQKGEITFIVGGNGSGKSTLGKLITLHYLAESGDMRFGDLPVTSDSVMSCRAQITSIYSDYYLFDRLLVGAGGPDAAARVERYLTALKLNGKVLFHNGRFSNTSALSDGQRRRLALVVAWMEDKSVYLFDEWAADQDSEFKTVFYGEILRDLKARGKVVVVITHDERFFHVADQIVELEDGGVKRIVRQAQDARQLA